MFSCEFWEILKARIHCKIYFSDCFMKHNLMHISLHLIWFHEIRIKYVKRKPPRTIIRKNAISPCLPRLHVVDIGWLFLMKRLFSQETVFFIILLEIKTRSFTIEFRGSWALNNSELVNFAGYSNIRQNISKYQATYR